MTAASYIFCEVVDLSSASGIAEDLIRYINLSPTPSVDASGLRQAGVPLLQILVAARRMAAAQGKPFTIEAAPDSALATLLSTCGMDPALCGAPASLVPPADANSTQRN